MTAVTALLIFFERKSLQKKEVLSIGLAIIVMGILHLIFRFPSNDFFGYNRGVAAFYQHYAWNYKWRTHGTFDAWLYWEDLAKKQFGDCNSMWCVIKTQPGIFISNTLFNIRTYFMQLLKTASFVFPIGVFHGKKMQLLLTVCCIIAFIILLIYQPSRKYFVENSFIARLCGTPFIKL